MSVTSTDAASSPPSSSPSSPPLSSTTPAATPTSLTVVLPITLASLSAPGPIIILSLPATTLEPCPIPASPFEFSSSITTSSTSTTSESSTTTAVGESTTVATPSSGQLQVEITEVYTATVAFTTTIPRTAVTGPTIVELTDCSRTNIGAIVGGAIGGVGSLIILALLAVFCSRKRRKDEFDGNFDPAHVKGGRGSGTLPKIDLLEDGLMDNNGLEVDDGMGGRLGAGPGCGGIITPYPFQLAPVSGSTVGGQQHQNQLQMQQMSNIRVAADGVRAALAAGCPNKKRAMRQQYVQHTPNQPISPRSFYPSLFYPNTHLNPNGVSPESYSVLTSNGFSSLGGTSSGSGEIYYQSMGRGHSPGPSVLKQLTPSSGRRNANEMEAMVISNPDDGRGQFRVPAFQQAYLPTGSGPHQQRQCLSSSSPTTVPSQPLIPSREGTAVYEDGGRVVLGEAGGRGRGVEP